jgi:hypothetical protein
VDISIDGVTSTQTDIIYSVNEFAIEPRFTLFGNPAGNKVYDVPQNEADMSPAATARTGPAYARFLNASCTTQQCWENENGIDFDHEQAIATIGLYARSVDPITGKCQGQERSYGGSWCTVRDNFAVSCSNSTCTLTAQDYRFQVSQIRIPGSQITTIVQSDCPTAQVFPVPRGVQVQITNVNSFAIIVRLVITGKHTACDLLYLC